MRRLLLKLADKIYSKCGFPKIDMYSRVLFRNHLYKIIDYKLEENEEKLETLTVKLREDMSLSEYLDNRKNISKEG